MKQLLNCPFCGEKPEIKSYKKQGVEYWSIHCINDACLVYVVTDEFEIKEKALKAWNKRSLVKKVLK